MTRVYISLPRLASHTRSTPGPSQSSIRRVPRVRRTRVPPRARTSTAVNSTAVAPTTATLRRPCVPLRRQDAQRAERSGGLCGRRAASRAQTSPPRCAACAPARPFLQNEAKPGQAFRVFPSFTVRPARRGEPCGTKPPPTRENKANADRQKQSQRRPGKTKPTPTVKNKATADSPRLHPSRRGERMSRSDRRGGPGPTHVRAKRGLAPQGRAVRPGGARPPFAAELAPTVQNKPIAPPPHPRKRTQPPVGVPNPSPPGEKMSRSDR